MLVSVSTVPTEVSIVDTEGDLFDVGDCDAAMFVFSTVSRRSFDVIEGLTDRINQLHRSGCLLALVGTGTDLDPQQVLFEEGSSLAQRMGAEYFHISVKNPERAEVPFTSLLNRFVQPQPDPRIQTAIEKLSPPPLLWSGCLLPPVGRSEVRQTLDLLSSRRSIPKIDDHFFCIDAHPHRL